jgi:hypothetical protein
MRTLSTLVASLTAVLFLLNLGCPALSHSDEHEEGTNPPGDRDYFDFSGGNSGGHGDDDDIPGDDDDAWGDDDDAWGDDDDMGGDLSEGDFLDSGMPLICALLLECLPSKKIQLMGWETVGDCIDDEPIVIAMMSGCVEGYTYESEFANACIDELEAADCGTFEDGEGMMNCSQVFVCGEGEPT